MIDGDRNDMTPAEGESDGGMTEHVRLASVEGHDTSSFVASTSSAMRKTNLM
jgi:hypothetical protein